ncbi:MAG: hypothetical protein ACXACY_19235 [Candidatus Hodarchaeales archaeon]|jgi:hypothetical protein
MDLFEHQNELPEEILEIILRYQKMNIECDMDYSDTAMFLKEMEALGYTFEYGLDNEPFNLRKL